MIAYNCNPSFFSFFSLSFLFCFSFWTVPLKRFLFVYKTFCLRETLEVSGLDYEREELGFEDLDDYCRKAEDTFLFY